MIKRSTIALFFSIVIVTLIIIFSVNNKKNTDIFIISTFWLIGIYSTIMIASNSKYVTYSCTNMHWMFCLLFFFIAPYLQYCTDNWALSYNPTNEQLYRTNILILLWMIIYHRGVKSKIKLHRNINVLKYSKRNIKNPSMNYLLIANITSILFVIFMSVRAGFFTIISSRSGGGSAFSFSDSATSTLITYIVRNHITFTALLNLYRYKAKKDNRLLCIISVMTLLIGCSPIGMPRYQTAAVYLSVLFILFPKWKTKKSFIVFFLSAFAIVFPMLDSFRYSTFSSVDLSNTFKNIFENIGDYFLTGAFDAYVMFMKIYDYVIKNGIQYGRQLLGAILFFVPRSLWKNKPISTSTMVQNALGITGAAANVSSPIISEGYADFGFIGIILYAYFFGIISRKIDIKIRNCLITKEINDIILLLIPPMIFFMCRGSLLSVWGFLASFIVVGKIEIFLGSK